MLDTGLYNSPGRTNRELSNVSFHVSSSSQETFIIPIYWGKKIQTAKQTPHLSKRRRARCCVKPLQFTFPTNSVNGSPSPAGVRYLLSWMYPSTLCSSFPNIPQGLKFNTHLSPVLREGGGSVTGVELYQSAASHCLQNHSENLAQQKKWKTHHFPFCLPVQQHGLQRLKIQEWDTASQLSVDPSNCANTMMKRGVGAVVGVELYRIEPNLLSNCTQVCQLQILHGGADFNNQPLAPGGQRVQSKAVNTPSKCRCACEI